MGARTRDQPATDVFPAESSGRITNKWIVLALVCMAEFMVVLDATVVTVALPSI